MPNPRLPSNNPDVIVVGAGPVGLALANLLGRAGIETLVLEADAELPTDLRASTFHPPTLEMLESLDATAEMLAQGLICPHWQVRLHPAGDRAVFDMSVIADETRYPFRLQCEQWKLSRILFARLQGQAAVETRFGHRIVDIRQSEDHAEVDVETPTGRQTLRAPFIIGCDGGRSTVRHTLKLGFDGVTYPGTTILATTPFPFEEHMEGLSNVSYCWKGDSNFSLLKVPGRWRLSIYPKEDSSIEEQMTPAAIEASLQDIVPKPEPYEVVELRPFTVHMRIVSNYRAGRILLAGDAAHVNPPSGGMGLNGGVHDAFCLAELLTEVVKRGANDATLDLYDRRRRPIAHDDILLQADRNRARMREKDPARRRELLTELQAIAADRARMKTYLLRTSMIEGLRRAATIN